MDIENLTKNIKTKLLKNSFIQNVKIEDKTFLHLKHFSHDKNKFHLKLIIYSIELKEIRKLDATKKNSQNFRGRNKKLHTFHTNFI